MNLFKIIGLAGLLALCSCEDNEIDFGLNEEQEALFSVSVKGEKEDGLQTRATDTYFENGDEVGIFVEKFNGSSWLYEYTNKRYVIENGQLKPVGELDKIHLQTGGVYNFYAYYPYKSNMTENYTLINTEDQRNLQNYKSCDFLLARNLSFNNTGGAIALNFRHQLSLLEILFQKENNLYLTEARVHNLQNSCNINLKTGTITLNNSTASYKCLRYSTTSNYEILRLILPPQMVSDLRMNMDFSDKCSMSFFNNKDVFALGSGQKTTINARGGYLVTASYDNQKGTVENNGIVYNYGETGYMTAKPYADCRFVGWYDINDQTTLITSNPTITFTVTDRLLFLAKFEKSTVRLNFSYLPSNVTATVHIPESGDYIYGEYLRLSFSSTNSNGWMFQGIYENGMLLSEIGSLHFYATEDRTIIAKFKEKLFSFWNTYGREREGTGTFYYNLDETDVTRETFTAYVGEEFDFRCEMFYEPRNNTSCNITYLQRKINIRYNGNIIQTIDNPTTEFFRWIAPYSGNYSFDFIMTGRVDVGAGQKYEGGWSTYRNGFRRTP